MKRFGHSHRFEVLCTIFIQESRQLFLQRHRSGSGTKFNKGAGDIISTPLMIVDEKLTETAAAQRYKNISFNMRFAQALIYHAVYFKIVFAVGIIDCDHFAYRIVVSK